MARDCEIMLKIKTYLDKSSIHGIGLFANEDIKQGELIWAFTKDVDQFIPGPVLRDISKEEANFLENAAVYDEEEDTYCLVADNVRFINHSDKPNVGETDRTTDDLLEMFALKDIKKGEEITLDYNEMEEGSDDFSDIKYNEK